MARGQGMTNLKPILKGEEKMKKKLLLLSVIFLAGAFISGCAISHNSHVSNSSSGFSTSNEQLNRVEPGVTTREWVIDNFGEPKREEHLQNGEEVLVYENVKHTCNSFSLFLLFSSHTSENTIETVSFKIKDGIVKSYWIS